jgi:hypothetical protein
MIKTKNRQIRLSRINSEESLSLKRVGLRGVKKGEPGKAVGKPERPEVHRGSTVYFKL